MHACVRACVRACMRVFVRACVHACVRACVYACVVLTCVSVNGAGTIENKTVHVFTLFVLLSYLLMF